MKQLREVILFPFRHGINLSHQATYNLCVFIYCVCVCVCVYIYIYIYNVVIAAAALCFSK